MQVVDTKLYKVWRKEDYKELQGIVTLYDKDIAVFFTNVLH